jgi:hypothetical protein
MAYKHPKAIFIREIFRRRCIYSDTSRHFMQKLEADLPGLDKRFYSWSGTALLAFIEKTTACHAHRSAPH